MTDASFGSLSPRLLARKGGARPAMRSQMNMPEAISAPASKADLEDLGWNDLGEDDGVDTMSAEVIAIGSARAKHGDAISADLSKFDGPSPSITPSRNKAAGNKADRAAFTLRLDADRHLKLRLACTVRHCSAQQLVTDALDALLAGMPDIQKLAAQVGSN